MSMIYFAIPATKASFVFYNIGLFILCVCGGGAGGEVLETEQGASLEPHMS